MDNFNINLNRGFPRRNLLNERPEHAAQTRLIQDIDSLRRDVSMMSNSLMNVYNLMQTTHMAVLNMESIIYRNRYFTPFRSTNRYRPPTQNSHLSSTLFGGSGVPPPPPTLAPTLTELERLNNLINQGQRQSAPSPNTNSTNTATSENTSTPTASDNNSYVPAPTNPEIEALVFTSLLNTLNNELPGVRPTANFIHPNIMEVSYSTENFSNDIVNFIRNIN